MHGATAFTLIPNGASSSAEAFVNISIPAFDMQYESYPGSGLLPFSQLMFMMQPLLCFKNGKKN